MILLNRNNFAEPSNTRSVRWDETLGAFYYSAFRNGAWQNVAITEPFAVDVFRVQHGFETWTEVDGKRSRSTVLASVSSPMPQQQHDKATPIYSVPVFSRKLGGQREMVVKGRVATEALCDLVELLENDLTNEAPQVPVVSVSVTDSDFGAQPRFEIAQIVDRPATWTRPIVNFAA